MKKNKLGITRIDCEARGSYIYKSGETHQVATVLTHDSNKEDAELRAKLISEAFNVANETGKAPRQLANENEMLLEALIDAKNQICI